MPSLIPTSTPEGALAALVARYREQYGLVIFEVAVETGDAGLCARGRVLLPRQKEEALEVLRACDPSIVDRIEVLSDPSVPPLAWVSPLDAVVDVRRMPDRAADLSTQALRVDPPMRLLARHENWRLVQLFDQTLGWIEADALQDVSFDGWNAHRALAGATVAVEGPIDAVLQAARSREGHPYRLGGASESGIDCSALVQRAYWEAAHVLLPKFTGDQRRMGLRVSRAATEPGDLLFFKSRDKNFGHVAMALDSGGQTLIHAALSRGQVVVEPFEMVNGNYAFLGARRIARFAHDGASESRQPAARAARVEIDLSRPDTLRGYNVHVLGLAGAEGAAIARFLVAHGVTDVTSHDFSTPDSFEKNFRLSHVGLRPRERAERLRELLSMPVHRCLRDDYLQGIENADVIFLPQGWFLYECNAPIRALRERGKIVFSQMTDLYFRLAPCRIAAVTGTNGKSTTTRLLSDLMAASSISHLFAGNDRRNVQVLDRLENFDRDGVLVLEVSNRQLIDLAPAPHVAVVTNVTPDHVEEHGSFENYIAVKRKMVTSQTERDFAVLNHDDPTTRSFAGNTRARVLFFSLHPLDGDGAFVNERGELVLRRDGNTVILLPRSELSVRGDHNLANVLAASMAAWLCGVDVEIIRRVLRDFRGIQLRMEEVATIDGVVYVNDIKATTPEAALAAVSSFDVPVHVIVGGGDKGLDYSKLAAALVKRARHLIVLDSAGGHRVTEAVKAAGGVPRVTVVHDLEAAVRSAADVAKSGEAVLLSPACPGLFSMYMDDAKGFNSLVRALRVST